jgi:hypothetical protein
MRIRLTLDIERRRPDPAPVPEGDVYAQVERASYTDGPQLGFQREDPDDYEDRRRNERG